ncbi:hypothetical protein GQR58_029239 [Nymphon striatum]|nr:hypothetical protein GQR58_029239 [Nymphon striatum]
MRVTTTATGSSSSTGGSAAVGIALALTIANHTVSATTLRNVSTDGSVTMSAVGRSVSTSTATASAAGAPGDGQPGSPNDPAADTPDPDGDVNKQIAANRTLADDRAKENKPEGATDAESTSGTVETPSAESSTGPITVAAAIAVNIANTDAVADVPTGVTINAGGAVTIQASNNTDAEANADGSSNTEGGTAAVGIAVGINLANVNTIRHDHRHR